MIVLPDEDELPVGRQVDALIGKALRHSVAGVEAGRQAARLARQARRGRGRKRSKRPLETAPGRPQHIVTISGSRLRRS
jgi:hypothetical protein